MFSDLPRPRGRTCEAPTRGCTVVVADKGPRPKRRGGGLAPVPGAVHIRRAQERRPSDVGNETVGFRPCDCDEKAHDALRGPS
jgi:hypothetical protein